MDSHIISDAEEHLAERAAIHRFEGMLRHEEAERSGLLDSDQYRISCQIRFACALSKADRDRYWTIVEERDGRPYMESLKALALAYWNEKQGKK